MTTATTTESAAPETDDEGIPVDPPDLTSLAKRAAQSNRKIKYCCTECGRKVGKENLKVIRIQFREMGASGRVDASRVIGWLCMKGPRGKKSCLEKNPYWNSDPLIGSPGMADTRLAAKPKETA